MKVWEKQWLQDYLNGTITPEEFEELENALLEDPKFRASARSFLAMDSHLRQGEEKAILFSEAWSESTQSPPRRGLGVLPWLALAAAIALVVGFGFVRGFGVGDEKPDPAIAGDAGPNSEAGVAYISHAVDAVWDHPTELSEGAILLPGELVLKSGLVEIEVFSGTQILLEGPTALELVSTQHVICEYGKLRAHVPSHARGFRVDSSRFKLIDLGTEFGIDIAPGGDTQLHVFDGEVAIHPQANGDRDEAPQGNGQIVTEGRGLLWVGDEAPAPSPVSRDAFASFESVDDQRRDAVTSRTSSWREWGAQIEDDPRLLLRYDFDESDATLIDSGPSGYHGTIVGTEWATGRWEGKRALGFKRPTDRVRIDVPGEHDALTLMTWMRIDALPDHNQGVLLPDTYGDGRPHWVITSPGNLYFGARIPTRPDGTRPEKGYFVNQLINRGNVGTWVCYVFTYDRGSGTVAHFLNGRELTREPIIADQPLTIGPAAIGNWGLPQKAMAEALSADLGVQHLIGRIDEFAIWSVALDPQEIRAFYDTTRP